VIDWLGSFSAALRSAECGRVPGDQEAGWRPGWCRRPDRVSAHTPSPILPIPVTNVPNYVHRVAETA